MKTYNLKFISIAFLLVFIGIVFNSNANAQDWKKALKNGVNKAKNGEIKEKDKEKVKTDTGNSQESTTTTKNIEIKEETPVCARNLNTAIDRYIKEYQDLNNRVEADFDNYNFDIKLKDLERDIDYMQSTIKNCKTDAPNHNFNAIETKANKLIADYKALETTFQKKQDMQTYFNEIDRRLNSANHYIEMFPRMNFEKEQMTLTKKDMDFIKNYPKDEGNFYTNKIVESKAVINKMETEIDSDEFKEMIYQRLDEYYSDYDKERGVREAKILVRDLHYFEGVLFINNANLLELIAYGEKLTGKLDGVNNAAIDAVVVSDFHKKNINTIFFTSNLKLDPKLANETDFKTEFTAGEMIKGVVYLDATYKDIYESQYLIYTISSTANSFDILIENTSPTDIAKSYIEFFVVVDAANYVNNVNSGCHTANAMDFLGNLPLRPQKITFEIDTWDSDYYSHKQKELKAQILFNGANEAGLAKMNAYKAEVRNKYLKNVPLPKAKMKNSTYESQLVKMFNSIGWDEIFKKAIITSSEWHYEKNYKGIITGRTLHVSMVSTKNGNCMYQEFTVIQNKTSSGYSSFKLYSTGSQTDISCEKT